MTRHGLFLAAVLLSIVAGAPARAEPADDVAKLKSMEGNAKRLEAAAHAGAKVASFCANCHGDGGNSSKPDVPNLAGQHPRYLLDVMRQYAGGQRKNTEFKQRLIKVLSVDERVNLALFYSSQPVIHKQARDLALARKGKDLYAKNCADCHEESGRGTDKYARVAGQQVDYMNASLKSYRDGKRPNASRGMVESVMGMSDADIAALAAYIATMD